MPFDPVLLVADLVPSLLLMVSQAADAGCDLCMVSLGEALWNGLGGCSRDPRESHKWWKKVRARCCSWRSGTLHCLRVLLCAQHPQCLRCCAVRVGFCCCVGHLCSADSNRSSP